ncbi:MAG: circularly permuted type 2 ATP-grasp protein [Pseudomonadota bacterium]
MYDEMTSSNGAVRSAYSAIERWLEAVGPDALRTRSADAEQLFRRGGVTFAVYGEGGDPERLIPFDLIPRAFTAAEWRRLSRGVSQRARALNAFLSDVYGPQRILREGVMPERLIRDNPGFEPRLVGVRPPGGVFSHIVGVDIVRTGDDEFFVLEDNCRTPSGVSYMLENREIMMRLFPELFEACRVAPVDGYPMDLRRTLQSVAPEDAGPDPTVAILTPGTLNSAFYEHSFLADSMGVELVEGADLYCRGGRLWMRTTRGPRRIDVLYRRIDDAFLDPSYFRPDSVLGVPGLMETYLSGGVALVSAPGAGVADDKAIYTYVPDMIRFYLGEEPELPNVPTWRCAEPEALEHVLENLADLVVKEVDGSGGYGMLIGPKATAEERARFAEKLRAKPAGYVAQPTLALSTCPTLAADGVRGRHVDLRPFALVGAGGVVRLAPGGLTRVALKEGSLVVNSSQGGGVKDTWVLKEY